MFWGHTKNIDAIARLTELQSLSFNPSKKLSQDFINRLKKLKTLNLHLGAKENINEIEKNEIENLDIVRVRGLNDLSSLSKFPKLRILRIEDQKQLSEVCFAKTFPDLKHVKIINCKTLKSVKGLENLPQLDTLVISRTDVIFDSFIHIARLSENIENAGILYNEN